MGVTIDGNGVVTGVTGNIIQVSSKISTTPWAISQTGNVWRAFPGNELLITITPRSATSKFLLLGTITMGTDSNAVAMRFSRNGSPIGIGNSVGSRVRGGTRIHYLNSDGNHRSGTMSLNFLDSPATSSAIQYNIELMHEGGNAYINRNQTYNDDATVYSGIYTSNFTVMEVGV